MLLVKIKLSNYYSSFYVKLNALKEYIQTYTAKTFEYILLVLVTSWQL